MSKHNNNQSVYLDKLITSAHFPIQKGSIGSISKSILPNLEHTGIQSTLGQQRQHCVGTEGNLLISYKIDAFKNIKKVERPRQKIITKEYFFRPNHRDFINKVLCEMEEIHLDKIKRRNIHWQSGVKDLGENFSGFSGFVEGTADTFVSLPETSNYYEDVQNSNEFNNNTRSNVNTPNDDFEDTSNKHVSFTQSLSSIPGIKYLYLIYLLSISV